MRRPPFRCHSLRKPGTQYREHRPLNRLFTRWGERFETNRALMGHPPAGNVGLPNYLKCGERTPYENRPSLSLHGTPPPDCQMLCRHDRVFSAPQMRCESKRKKDESHQVYRGCWINQKQPGGNRHRTFRNIRFLPEPSSGAERQCRHAEGSRERRP